MGDVETRTYHPGVQMTQSHMENQAKFYLHKLCTEIDNRCVGSQGNRHATDFFTEMISAFGFEAESPEFECIDWSHGEIELTINGRPYPASVSPYSLGCHATAPLVAASTLDELENQDILGNILLLHGEIAKEQLMPKNFTFYNPENHQRKLPGRSSLLLHATQNWLAASTLFPYSKTVILIFLLSTPPRKRAAGLPSRWEARCF